jgi:hypothetical protein
VWRRCVKNLNLTRRRNERARIFLKINISWERPSWPEQRPV